MIELNLLPKELRKQKKRDLPEIPLLPVAAGIVALLLVIYVAAFVWTKGMGIRLNVLKQKWQEMQPQKKVADAVVQKSQEMERRLKVTTDIATPEPDWAELLSGLNQAVIAGVWLSEFKPVFKKDTKDKIARTMPVALNLTAHALGESEVATSTVAKFINSLKKNKEFSKYFSEIELKKMQSQSIKGEEVMTFRLVCEFKQKEQSKASNKPAKKRRRK